MIPYYLSDEEDYQLHHIVMYRSGRTLYEYMVEMPLEDLKAYPKKGYRWWMGRKAKSTRAMELRDYVLHWRLFALEFRQEYPLECLESLSTNALSFFLHTHLEKTPLWAYDGPTKDAARLLFYRTEFKEQTPEKSCTK